MNTLLNYLTIFLLTSKNMNSMSLLTITPVELAVVLLHELAPRSGIVIHQSFFSYY